MKVIIIVVIALALVGAFHIYDVLSQMPTLASIGG